MERPAGIAQRLMWVIWPAFLVAAVAEAIFFTVFDPFDLHFFGAPLEISREAIYTMGFFGFWALGIASSALTVFLERSPWEVNRCPLDAAGPARGLPEARRGRRVLRAGRCRSGRLSGAAPRRAERALRCAGRRAASAPRGRAA